MATVQRNGTGVSAEFAQKNANVPISPTDIANKGYVDSVVGGGIAIGDPVAGGTSKCVLYIDAMGNLAQDSGNFEYDDSAKQLSLFGAAGPQLVIGDSVNLSVSMRFYDDGGAFDSTFAIDPAAAIAHTGAFCQWKMIGSDFCFSYAGSPPVGGGVPNVTISGPPAGYTSASGPGFNLNNELEVADNKLWAGPILNAKACEWHVVNDANNSAFTWLRVTRSGVSITGIEMLADVTVQTNLTLKSADGTDTALLYCDNNGDVHLIPQTGTSKIINLQGTLADITVQTNLTLESPDGTDHGIFYCDNTGLLHILAQTGVATISLDSPISAVGALTVLNDMTVQTNFVLKSSDGTDHGTLYCDNSGTIHILPQTGTTALSLDMTSLGFFTHATASQQTVSGSRADPEAALSNLLTALAAYGLIVNSTGP